MIAPLVRSRFTALTLAMVVGSGALAYAADCCYTIEGKNCTAANNDQPDKCGCDSLSGSLGCAGNDVEQDLMIAVSVKAESGYNTPEVSPEWIPCTHKWKCKESSDLCRPGDRTSGHVCVKDEKRQEADTQTRYEYVNDDDICP